MFLRYLVASICSCLVSFDKIVYRLMVVLASLEKFSAVCSKVFYGFFERGSGLSLVRDVSASVVRMGPGKNFLSLNSMGPTKSYNISARSRAVDLWMEGSEPLIRAC